MSYNTGASVDVLYVGSTLPLLRPTYEPIALTLTVIFHKLSGACGKPQGVFRVHPPILCGACPILLCLISRQTWKWSSTFGGRIISLKTQTIYNSGCQQFDRIIFYFETVVFRAYFSVCRIPIFFILHSC